jgi:23S rRNA pseudouridine955/2504/2580 synthase
MEFNQVHYIIVDENHALQRIDNFLFSTLKKVPKGMIYKKIRKGEVRVNSKRVKQTYKIQLNDKIRIPPLYFDETKILNPESKIIKVVEDAILFENNDFILLNKPAGLAVHKGTNNPMGIIEILKSGSRPYVELVHRLDKATSGCLLVAKTRKALLALQEKLKAGHFKKQYLALTFGQWQKNHNKICKPIAQWRKRNAEKLMIISKEGKYAESWFDVEKVYKKWTLMRVDLQTGRTHQIRVHALSEGHALAGDSKYAPEHVVKAAKRAGIHSLCLHAQYLSFTLDKDYYFEAKLPKTFSEILKKIA